MIAMCASTQDVDTVVSMRSNAGGVVKGLCNEFECACDTCVAVDEFERLHGGTLLDQLSASTVAGVPKAAGKKVYCLFKGRLGTDALASTVGSFIVDVSVHTAKKRVL